MAEALNDLKKKYKVHEETESYFKLRTENGNNKPYYEMSNFDEARIQKEEIAKQFGGEVEFEGSVKDFTVPSPYVKGMFIWLKAFMLSRKKRGGELFPDNCRLP